MQQACYQACQFNVYPENLSLVGRPIRGTDSESGFLIGQPASNLYKNFYIDSSLDKLLPYNCFSYSPLDPHKEKWKNIFIIDRSLLFFFLKFRKSPSNPRRYRKQVICGYSVPTLFLTMTGIAEASLSQCSRFRPRFNEQSCFFSGNFAFQTCSFDFQIAINFDFFLHQILKQRASGFSCRLVLPSLPIR